MIPAGVKVFFSTKPADMRKSFDGLATEARGALGQDPRSGSLFVFLNRRGDQVRILFADRHGWCILAKRLDGARFRRSLQPDGSAYWEADAKALLQFLEEVDLVAVRQPHQRRRPTAANGIQLSAVPDMMQ